LECEKNIRLERELTSSIILHPCHIIWQTNPIFSLNKDVPSCHHRRCSNIVTLLSVSDPPRYKSLVQQRKGLAQNAKFSHAKAFEEDKYSTLYVVNLQNLLALK